MKKNIVIIFLGLLLVSMAFTNPSQESYVSWAKQEILADAEDDTNRETLGAIVGMILTSNTKCQNYLLLSVYTTSLDNNTYFRTLGFFNRFIILG